MSGYLCGGAVITYFGGSHTYRTLTFTQIICWMTLIAVVPMPFVSSFPIFATLLWLIFFYTRIILAVLTCIMLDSVEERFLGPANGLLQFG